MDYKKLTDDLRAAHNAALVATDRIEDNGTANMDKVFLTLPRARETKVLEAIKEAGLYCRGKRRWIGEGYMLSVSKGQANQRDKAVTVFVDVMVNRGYDAIAYRQMD
ncbi:MULTISPECIES: hypothetical protein [Paenibacillus]|uniref:Uncharacterized protein n=2 Tax=Paenibacillus TaxID=44249 RepID=A0AAP3ZWN8_PAEPO|nr:MULTISPECIES: hypothetical protein [Paenibacillus]MDH2330463.1 hypothetical protein [Paenibacillus polymyxa]MDR6776292.1 hypothetical protein [Paenibacillus peoriae]OMF46577.1 hypothetical protein BK135_12135 [Paenibacillus peoriae]